MNAVPADVWRKTSLMMIASVLVAGLNIFAAVTADRPLIFVALGFTACFALIGVGFGRWVALRVTRAGLQPD
jgi:hypothetical protein